MIETIILFALAVITAFYAWTTFRIVKETVKDRRIRMIERALEEFYYPLLNIDDVENYRYAPGPYWVEYSGEILAAKFQVLQNYWENIERHQYLAISEDAKIMLGSFKKTCIDFYNGRLGKEVVEQQSNWVVSRVKKNIKVLENELEKLQSE